MGRGCRRAATLPRAQRAFHHEQSSPKTEDEQSLVRSREKEGFCPALLGPPPTSPPAHTPAGPMPGGAVSHTGVHGSTPQVNGAGTMSAAACGVHTLSIFPVCAHPLQLTLSRSFFLLLKSPLHLVPTEWEFSCGRVLIFLTQWKYLAFSIIFSSPDTIHRQYFFFFYAVFSRDCLFNDDL